jgi:excisionase family DNA binding protein
VTARRFFSVRDIAERWGVSDKTVRRQIASGALAPVVFFGRTLRIPSDAVESAERRAQV